MGFLNSSDKFKRKLQTQLKMATHRMNLLKNKKSNQIKIEKRQVANLLRQDKNESARIKVENVIRDDYCLEAYDILLLFCELLLSRIQLVAESKECPFDLKEAVSTLIYSAPRINVGELSEVRKLFAKKFGKKFVKESMENKSLSVNQRVIFKLGLQVPKPYLCVQYLKKIAEENNVPWDDEDEELQNEQQLNENPDMDYSKDTTGTGYNTNGFQQTQTQGYQQQPQQPIYPNPHAQPTQPSYPQQPQNVFSSIPTNPQPPIMQQPVMQPPLAPSQQTINRPTITPNYNQNFAEMPNLDQFVNEEKRDQPRNQSLQVEDDDEDELTKKLAQLKTGGNSNGSLPPRQEDPEDDFSQYDGSVSSQYQDFEKPPQYNFSPSSGQSQQNTMTNQPNTIEVEKPDSSKKAEYDFDLLQQRFQSLKNRK